MQSDPSPAGIRDHCIALIHDSRVMTLSTGTHPLEGQSSVWAAPVYYLFRNKFFYFFSNPKARHIKEGKNRPAAASIFKDASEFSGLKGIQMSGWIDYCAKGSQSLAVALDYAVRFGIRPDPGNILLFFKTRFNARLYRFNAQETYYMDNGRGIGTRTRLEL